MKQTSIKSNLANIGPLLVITLPLLFVGVTAASSCRRTLTLPPSSAT